MLRSWNIITLPYIIGTLHVKESTWYELSSPELGGNWEAATYFSHPLHLNNFNIIHDNRFSVKIYLEKISQKRISFSTHSSKIKSSELSWNSPMLLYSYMSHNRLSNIQFYDVSFFCRRQLSNGMQWHRTFFMISDAWRETLFLPALLQRITAKFNGYTS